MKFMEQKIKYVEVALPLPIDQTFTYLIPKEMQDMLTFGMRVLVPFGERTLTGYAVDFSFITTLDEVREIYDILDDKPVISTELFRLAKWISEYYICPIGEVLKTMLPRGMSSEQQVVISLQAAQKLRGRKITTNQRKLYQYLLQNKKATLQQLRKKLAISNLNHSVSVLEKYGIIKREIILKSLKARPKHEKWLRISSNFFNPQQKKEVANIKKRAPKQLLCLKWIYKKKEIPQKQLLKITGANTSCINKLLEKKLIEQFEKEVFRDYYQVGKTKSTPKITLNEEQRLAVNEIEKAIKRGFFTTFLLHGVTGSGKTQVYIETIKKVLALGRTAIVLVPEIALTPQTVSRFTANFPDLIAVLHSKMSVGERYDSWRKLEQGQFKIAIGPRSAIFAPLHRLGLIVVDEEQEASYKQGDNAPYYHARDVAVVRGKLNEAVVVLGSATPSVESFYNARIGKYQLLELENRIDNVPLPQVKIIDMLEQRRKYRGINVAILSKPLQDKIKEKLQRREQIIILQNRRGYSTFIKCKDCGYIEKCVNCDISLTYHVTVHRLRCHYCNYIKKAPDVCPKCQSRDILFRGIGTQQVELELQTLFPDARIVRMDLDTTSQKKSHDEILHNFARHQYDILLGTQMVAKGLDFARVTLVGVVSADTSLLIPDFRASERTFQLLTQVAGRAGRKNLKGEVFIQTYSPDNFGIICARTHDFKRFFATEIFQRKELNYPPFSRLIQILFRSENEQDLILAVTKFKELIPENDELYQILGPVPAPLSKIQNYYRWHIILKVNKRNDPAGNIVNKLIKNVVISVKKEIIKIKINVDPVSLL